KDRMGTPGLIVVSKSETVRSAIDMMQRYGISQIPVVADGDASKLADIVGSVQEKTMLDRVFREPALVEEKVERVMEAPFPVAQLAVCRERAQGVGERTHATRCDEQRRVTRDLSRRGDVAGDRRQPVRERGRERHAVRLAH